MSLSFGRNGKVCIFALRYIGMVIGFQPVLRFGGGGDEEWPWFFPDCCREGLEGLFRDGVYEMV